MDYVYEWSGKLTNNVVSLYLPAKIEEKETKIK